METGNEDAVQAGAAVLKNFVAVRPKRSQQESLSEDSKVDLSASMYYDAVADGSSVGRVYSASKRGLNVTDSDLVFGTPDEMSRFATADSETILVLRDVLLKLKEDNKTDAINVLRSLEERMAGYWNKPVNPLSPIGKENSVPNTPVVDKYKSHLESQLRELTERLEVVEEERDEQADLAKSLQDDLAGRDILIEEQKEEIALHKKVCDDLTSQLTEAMEHENLANTPTPKKATALSGDGKVTTPSSEDAKKTREVLNVFMENQLELNAVEQSEHEKMIDELMDRLAQAESEIKKKSEELVDVKEELEEQEAAEADLKSRNMVLENTLLKLRGGDEVVTTEVSMNMEDLQDRLDQERERNRVLQAMVESMKEESEDTEELLDLLKEDKSVLESEFDSLQKSFDEQREELVTASQQVKSLSLTLDESREKEASAIAKRDELEEQVATIKVQLDDIGNSLDGESDVLKKKLGVLTEQKTELTTQIKQQKRDIDEKEELLQVKEMELQRSQEDFERTKEALRDALDEVEKESSQRAELMKELQGLLLLRQNSPSMDMSTDEGESALNMSGLSSSAWGNNSPENSMLAGGGGGLDSSRDGAAAEVQMLAEKLGNAERRAAEAVQKDVEHITKTAILDGECLRLRKMTVELKDTNTKLLDDVESAKREADRYKALEKTAKKLKTDLHSARRALDEAGRHKKNLEEQVTFKETELRSTFDSETDELQSKVESLERQLKESKEYTTKMSTNEERLEGEISSLMNERDEMRKEIDSLEEECKKAINSTEEVTEETERRTKELSEMREELTNEKEKVMTVNAELTREREGFSERIEALNNDKIALEKDVEKASEHTKALADQVKDLQAQSETLEGQLEETTKSLASAEREKQTLSEQKARDEEELSKRYKRISCLEERADDMESALENFKAKDHQLLLDDYASTTNDLEATRVDLQCSMERTAEKEKLLENARAEYAELLSKQQVVEKALKTLQDTDLQEREEQVRALQKELQQRMHDQSALEGQFADRSALLGQAEKDLEEVRNAEAEKKAQIEELLTRLGVVEDEKRAVVADLTARMGADVKLGAELAAINDGLSGCLSVTSTNASLSPAPAQAAATLATLSSSVASGSHDVSTIIDSLRGSCGEVQKLLYSQGSERNELWHEQEDKQHQLDNLQMQVQSLQSIRDGLTTDVVRLNEALAMSEQKVDVREREAEKLQQGADEWNGKVRGLVRELKATISDAYSHVTRLHVAAGGEDPSLSFDRIPSPTKTNSSSSSSSSSTAEGESAVNLLSQVNVELETALRMLVSAMESASQQAMVRKVALDAAEASLVDQRVQVQRDLDTSAVMEEQIAKDGEKLESAQSLQRQLASVKHEHSQYKVLLSELNKNKIELQAELDSSQAIIGDLRGALTEAERLCEDYRAQHSTLLEEHDGLSSHMRILQQQSVAAVERAEECGGVAETAKREVTSLRQEMEEMVRLQKTLESELARREKDSAPPTPAHPTKDLEGDLEGPVAAGEAAGSLISNFDSERLLGAVYSTADQVMACSFASDAESMQHVHKLQSLSRAALEINSGASMASRYEAGIRFLGEMRAWTRNEKKARRVLQNKLSEAEKELAKVQHELSEKQRHEKQWKEAKHVGDTEIRALERKVREMQGSTERRSNDVTRMRDSIASWEKRYEEERALRLQYSKQVQLLDMDLNKARVQASDDKTTIGNLDGKLDGAREKADKLEQDAARASEEIRALKSNNTRLVHLLEVDSARAPAGSASADQAEGARTLISSLQARVTELEGSLSAAKTQVQQAKQGKTNVELSSASARRDLESIKGKFSLVEARHRDLESEKNRLQEDLLDAKASVTSAEQRAQLAEDRLTRAEASLGLSTKPTAVSGDKLAPYVEANHQQIKALQARLDETDKSRRQAEEERVGLRGHLSELRSQLDRQGGETATYKVTKEALERELMQCKQQLAHATDLSTGAGAMRELVSSLLSTDEGKDLKRRVREATLTTREVVNLVRADAVAADNTYFSSPEPKGTSDHPLLEATGVRELSEGLEALRQCIGWLREAPRQRSDLTANYARQEANLKGTQKELSAAQRRHETAMACLQAELRAVESQLATEQGRNLTLRDKSASVEAEGRASIMLRERLEKDLRSEKARCQALEENTKQLEGQIDDAEELLEKRSRQLQAAEEELTKVDLFSSDGGSGTRRTSTDDNAVATQQELRAMSHHRDALCATIDRLEEKVRLLSSSTSAFAGARAGTNDDAESDVKQEARLRSRLEALESVVGIYKSGLMALHGHSVSYSYSQYLASTRGLGDDNGDLPLQVTIGSWSGWGQLELATLRSSFEAELKAVDAEVIELRGKVRQSQAFSAELSRRFQKLLSESYSGGGGAIAGMTGTSGHASHVDALRHLEGSTREALEEAAKLRTSLHDEKEQSRRRHRQLVEVLNGTIAEKEAVEAALKAIEISGVVVPAIVRRADFRPNPNLSLGAPATHLHAAVNAHSGNTSFSFQSPVKTYRSSPPVDHPVGAEADFLDLPSSPPLTMRPPAAAMATTTTTTTSSTSRHSSYNLRTKGANGRGALRVRRAAPNKFGGDEQS